MSTVTVTLKANGKSESSKSCTTYIAAVFIYRFLQTSLYEQDFTVILLGFICVSFV